MQQYGQTFPYFKYVILFELGTEQENNSDYKQERGKKEKRTIINEWQDPPSHPTSHSSAPYEDALRPGRQTGVRAGGQSYYRV